MSELRDVRKAVWAYAGEAQHAYAGHNRNYSAERAFDALENVLDACDNPDGLGLLSVNTVVWAIQQAFE